MKTVTQRPCTGWVTDSLGETTERAFDTPRSLVASEVSPGASTEAGQATDDTVTSHCQLLFAGKHVPSTAHDQWTIDSLVWEQDGEGGAWPLGTVINLVRRTG